MRAELAVKKGYCGWNIFSRGTFSISCAIAQLSQKPKASSKKYSVGKSSCRKKPLANGILPKEMMGSTAAPHTGQVFMPAPCRIGLMPGGNCCSYLYTAIVESFP